MSALIFAAVCAYAGTAVYAALQNTPQSSLPTLAKSEGGELRGIILRCEQSLTEAPSAEAGTRIPAGNFSSESAIFMPDSDGYEHIAPADLDSFDSVKLKELMQSPPESGGGAKLIYGFDCYFAAFYKGESDIEPGPCRIRFEGDTEILRAEIISVSRSEADCVLLLRLMLNEKLLQRRFCSAELIYN